MSVAMSPLSLEELAIGSVFGVNRKESIEQLMHLSHKETMELIVALNHSKGGRTKYEPSLGCCYGDQLTQMYQVNANFFHENCKKISNYQELTSLASLMDHVHVLMNECENISKTFLSKNKYRNTHPICQTINTKNTGDIIKNYYERRSRILSLPFPPAGGPPPKIPSLEETSYYYDPIIFLDVSHYHGDRNNYQCMELFIEVIISPIIESYSTIRLHLHKFINDLKKKSKYIRKKIYRLVTALLLHIKFHTSFFPAIAERRLSAKRTNAENMLDLRKEELILMSLEIIICLRNFVELTTNIINKTITPMLELCNYISLEDALEAFKIRITGLRSDIIFITAAMENKDMLEEKEEPFLLARKTVEKKKSCILLSKTEIIKIKSFLKRRYPDLIMHKKFVVKYLLKKIKKNDSTDALIRGLRKEIEEMELFLDTSAPYPHKNFKK